MNHVDVHFTLQARDFLAASDDRADFLVTFDGQCDKSEILREIKDAGTFLAMATAAIRGIQDRPTKRVMQREVREARGRLREAIVRHSQRSVNEPVA